MQDQFSHDECADEAPKDTSESFSGLPPIDREKFKGRLPEYRDDLEQCRRAYLQLKENYPDFFRNMQVDAPRTSRYMDRLSEIIGQFENNENFSDEQVLAKVDEYNNLSRELNGLFDRIRFRNAEAPDKVLVDLADGKGIDKQFLEELSADEKTELIGFGKALYKEIFPDSYVDTAVKFYTNRDELSDFQRYSLIPANGIESLGRGVVGLFDSDTWKDLSLSAKTLLNMTEDDYKTAWEFIKFEYGQLSTVDKVEPVLTFLMSVIFLLGGLSSLARITSNLPHATGVMALLESGAIARSVSYNIPTIALPLPAAILGGLHLKYI